ncbi:uncharacterized protein BO96DRAFT_470848 [Aspergillus niger CBS 101883]|uniref:Uncharacterized protein n=2 Tax=Aspergillus niger TaxID=5061 RepID=A2QV54_ASPNC|nr:uncharacterized protein BO96DRAFT_470848 [Aspergillus niger CBS 101883]XP_059601519.1 hypothetical protein An10g01060 [Aspergillus niger]PYH50326.1 hypothetical protein BO96DRAFT_470848 [Aspergillus niger CBS 101883]CAK40541.1 hypothetical protein An10g01060 [Aspergillus niger]
MRHGMDMGHMQGSDHSQEINDHNPAAHGMTFEFVPWNGTELWMEEGEGKGREGKGWAGLD